MHSLAQCVLFHVRRQELVQPGDRVGVAVSGGIDSVALLRLLIELRHELGLVVSVIHFNHKLRGAESDADQEFVAGLALHHGLEFHCDHGDAAQLAAEEHRGLEAAARELRYEFFRGLLDSEPQGLKPNSIDDPLRDAKAPLLHGDPDRTVEAALFPILDKIATGHTLDDQAETVLMRLIRGTGMRGLRAIHPRIVVEHQDGEGQGEIIRPLLGVRRSELEKYLTDLKQPWREDATNAESKFTRNRIRKLVLPLLEREFNPAVVESLSEIAEIARDEEDYWDNEISGWLGTVVQWSQPEWTRGLPGFRAAPALVQIQPSQDLHIDPELQARLDQLGPVIMNASVSRPWLLTEAKAVQRRVLKAIGEQAGIPLEFKHIEEILRFAQEDGPSGKELSLPLGWKIVREPEAVVFVTPDLRHQERAPDYEYLLPVPGRVAVPEIGVLIEALRLTPESSMTEYNPQQLLSAELLPRQLTVRNWRPGDQFWPAHTRAPKKVKELLQEQHVTNPARRLWPVVARAGEIVWMRGFPVPARFLSKTGEPAVLVREMPWEVRSTPPSGL